MNQNKQQSPFYRTPLTIYTIINYYLCGKSNRLPVFECQVHV